MNNQDKVKLWRQRFYGRQTAFGRKENGGSYHPVFNNASSMHGPERFKPLEDIDVLGHLDGKWDLLIYLLHEDERVKFCAVDFDSKHTFKDVLTCKKAIIAAGIPCAMARSTKKGHHIYIFFDKMIEPKYVISFFAHLYEEIGFSQLNRDNIRPLPETFPKTTHLGDSAAIGMGIKPPMHGTGTKKGQNCWVDDENYPVGGKGDCDEQWQYLADIPDASTEDFIKILELAGIPILENKRLSESRGIVDDLPKGRLTPYTPPEKGDFEMVVNSCPALKELWENADSATHDARTGILSFALHTKNGLDILRKRWPSEKTEYHLNYAINRNYRPWSCYKLQEMGICTKGRHPLKASKHAQVINGVSLTDYCLKSLPPKEVSQGKLLNNPNNIPQSEWPLPSPIRFAFGGSRKESIKEDVPPVVAAPTDSASPTAPDIVPNQDEQAVGSVVYRTPGRGQGYFRVTVNQKGEEIVTHLSNFTVELNKEITIYRAIGGSDVTISGTFYRDDYKSDFEVSSRDWNANAKFISMIGENLKATAIYESRYLDQIRSCVSLFGMRNITMEEKVEDYGFNKPPTYYAATNCTITKDGIDTENIMLANTRGPTSVLHITPLTDDEFTQACEFLFEDVLSFQNPNITRTVVAHAFQALIQNAYLPIETSPVVWLQGLTGSGKSTLAKVAQFFHTDKTNIMINVNSTMRSLELATMLFKDTLLVIDDYKNKSQGEIAELVQKLYDRSGRTRLNGGIKQGGSYYSEEVRNRGLSLVTGEDITRMDASVVARCIVLEYTNVAPEDSAEKLHRIFDNRRLLSGISGRFIQYMLKNPPDPKVILRRYNDYSMMLNRNKKDDVKKIQNSERIASNLAANVLSLDLFLEFMLAEKMLGQTAVRDMAAAHWKFVMDLNGWMQDMCTKEQASNVFVDILKELLSSGRVVLEGYHDLSRHKSATIAGFVVPKDEHVYLYPRTCYELIKKSVFVSGQTFNFSIEAIGKQLKHDDLLAKQTAHSTQYVKKFGGMSRRVWCVKKDVLDILTLVDQVDDPVIVEEAVHRGIDPATL